MFCMKNLRFSSRSRVKVRCQGPPGSARARTALNWLKMEMEDMIMAVQDQTLRTSTIKTIDKLNVPAECRMAEKVMRQLAINYCIGMQETCSKAMSML